MVLRPWMYVVLALGFTALAVVCVTTGTVSGVILGVVSSLSCWWMAHESRKYWSLK